MCLAKWNILRSEEIRMRIECVSRLERIEIFIKILPIITD